MWILNLIKLNLPINNNEKVISRFTLFDHISSILERSCFQSICYSQSLPFVKVLWNYKQSLLCFVLYIKPKIMFIMQCFIIGQKCINEPPLIRKNPENSLLVLLFLRKICFSLLVNSLLLPRIETFDKNSSYIFLFLIVDPMRIRLQESLKMENDSIVKMTKN